MRQILSIIFILLFSGLGAQDVPYIHRINQYLFNGTVLNPAYAGSREALSTTMMHRTQWAGFKGAPLSQSIAAHTPQKMKRLPLVLLLITFPCQAHSITAFILIMAYRIWLGGTRLSLGLKAGGYMYKETVSKLNLRDPIDPSFVGKSGIAPNFGAGAYFYNERYFVGVSIPFLLSQSDTSTLAFDYNYNHYMLTAGYIFDINKNFKLKPNFTG